MITKARRAELSQGKEAMLLQEGWIYEGPKYKIPEDRPPSWMKLWINPRTQRKYTLDGAVAIEELKETL